MKTAAEALDEGPGSTPATPRLLGELLRRASAVNVAKERLETALRALPKEALREALETLDVAALEAALVRAADEAVEAGLSDDADERELWSSSALEALTARDVAESITLAVGRWRELGGTLDPKTQKGFTKLTTALGRLDRALKGKARWFTPLNAYRRVERDLLEPPHRDTAWWFTSRAGCDELISKLSGQLTTDEKHFRTCPDCRRDLEHTATVDQPPRRHLTPDELWNYDLGLMSLSERRAAVAHADECLDCAQLLHAVAEGEKAISEASEWEAREPAHKRQGPSATEGYASTRRPGRHLVAAQNEFRVLLIRDARRVRLLVQPLTGRALAAAAVHLLPRRPIEPHPTPEGLEYELGESGPLMGQLVRVRVRVTAEAVPFERDIEL
ncbi:MAG TPA: hypothetical protein VK447_11175 [Myxococcaceae bacterium]|nr:hypothetical protein [Myxococcaceae bacterium]